MPERGVEEPDDGCDARKDEKVRPELSQVVPERIGAGTGWGRAARRHGVLLPEGGELGRSRGQGDRGRRLAPIEIEIEIEIEMIPH